MAKKAKKAKRGKVTKPIAEQPQEQVQHQPPPGAVEQRFDPVWAIGCIVVTAAAFFLRFFWLGLKPFHHDEGVNGWFLTTLFRDGVYRYDPANYHGPTLYYISLAFAKVFGLETVPVRWSMAIWGVLMVVLVLFLRKYIGKTGALAGAALVALSPGMVFISRYFIHEIFFVFLSLSLVVAVVYFIDRRRAGPFAIGWTALLLLVCFFPSTLHLAGALSGADGSGFTLYGTIFLLIEAVLVTFVIRMLMTWRDGRPIYMMLASASVALFFATKETAFITLGTMLIAVLCVVLWRKFYGSGLGLEENDSIDDSGLTFARFGEAMGGKADRILLITIAAVVFIYVSVLFFSSFFTFPDGIGRAFEAYKIWTKTGTRDHSDNSFYTYLKWAWEIEAPIVILSAVGTLIAFVKARHRFAMFVGMWTFGLFLAYSLIPYKTPWLALSFLLPACIVGGYAINEIAKLKDPAGGVTAGLLALAAFGILGYKTYDLNFVRYDDDSLPYVYAHTRRGFLDMVGEIDRYAETSQKGNDLRIDIVSPDYWPLVWYLKDYKGAGFSGRLVENPTAEMIVAKKRDQDAEITRRYSANYKYVGTYPLRPGVDLVLLVRREIADNKTLEINQMNLSR